MKPVFILGILSLIGSSSVAHANWYMVNVLGSQNPTCVEVADGHDPIRDLSTFWSLNSADHITTDGFPVKDGQLKTLLVHFEGKDLIFAFADSEAACKESLARVSGLVSVYVDRLPPKSSDGEQQGDNTPAVASAGRTWFSRDVINTKCFETHSPADQIKELQEGGHEVSTRDFGDPSDPNKVEVSITEESDDQTIWTFYRSEPECEGDLPVNKAIPDKYK